MEEYSQEEIALVLLVAEDIKYITGALDLHLSAKLAPKGTTAPILNFTTTPRAEFNVMAGPTSYFNYLLEDELKLLFCNRKHP